MNLYYQVVQDTVLLYNIQYVFTVFVCLSLSLTDTSADLVSKSPSFSLTYEHPHTGSFCYIEVASIAELGTLFTP